MSDPNWPMDNHRWTVTCFGRVEQNLAVPSEPTIQLLLAREEKGTDSPPRMVRVGVGMLPAHTLGRVFSNAEAVGETGHDTFDEIVAFDYQKMCYVEAWDLMTKLGPSFNKRHRIIPPFVVAIPQEVKDSPFLVIPLKERPKDYLIIAGPEVARIWFLRSTFLAHTLLADPVDITAAAFIKSAEEKDGKLRISFSKKVGRPDFPVALATQYSKLFRDQANAMFNRLSADRIRGLPCYLQPLPPVEGDGRVRAQGFRFIDKTTGAQRFIATRLLAAPAITMDISLEKFVVLCGEGRNDDEYESASSAEMTYKPRRGRLSHSIAKVRHSDEPNRNLAEETFDARLAIFHDMPVISERAPEGRDGKRGLYRPAIPGEESSSGWGKSSGNVDPARVRGSALTSGEVAASVKQKALQASFKYIIKAMERFQALFGGTCRALGEISQYEGNEIATLTFPTTLDDEIFPWSYVDTDCARRVLAIEFQLSNRFAYLLDIERREDSQEKYTMLAIVDLAFKKIEVARLGDLAAQLGLRTKGVWLQVSESGERLTKWKHTFSDVEQLALRVRALFDMKDTNAELPAQIFSEQEQLQINS